MILLIVLSPICHSQVKFENKLGLVSNLAYNKKITKDFNYLLLGENSPQQGISTTLNDKKSNIKISGLLYSGNSGVLTMEADLSASNGIYYFDQEKGSEQGRVTLNYFKSFKRWSEFNKIDDLTKTTANLEILDLITKTKNEYEGLRELMQLIVIYDDKLQQINPIKEDLNEDKILEVLRKITEKHINSDDSKGFYKLKKEKMDTKPYIKIGEGDRVVINPKGNTKEVILNKGGNLKIVKILKDYNAKRKFIIKQLEDSIHKIELAAVKTKWAGNHILFWGVSSFYERQGFKRFTYNTNQEFNDMFTQERGNVYGLRLSLNYSLEKGEGSRNIYKPESLFVRLSATLSRASNISNFKNSTLDITTPLGNDVNGNPISFTNIDNAFIGDATYEYGFGRAFSLETYYYPFSIPVGIFGILGYQRINFNRTSIIDDKEIYPFRGGVLFSLTNKEKNKPKVTIQAFVDRTDLNLSANGDDQDLRFGLGVGLPFNF